METCFQQKAFQTTRSTEKQQRMIYSAMLFLARLKRKLRDLPLSLIRSNNLSIDYILIQFCSKTNPSTVKGRIAAKKIDNIDLNALSLNDDGVAIPKDNFNMTESAFGMKSQSPIKEVFSKGNSPYIGEQSNDEKLKKFQSAKAISSDSFKTESKYIVVF